MQPDCKPALPDPWVPTEGTLEELHERIIQGDEVFLDASLLPPHINPTEIDLEAVFNGASCPDFRSFFIRAAAFARSGTRYCWPNLLDDIIILDGWHQNTGEYGFAGLPYCETMHSLGSREEARMILGKVGTNPMGSTMACALRFAPGSNLQFFNKSGQPTDLSAESIEVFSRVAREIARGMPVPDFAKPDNYEFEMALKVALLPRLEQIQPEIGDLAFEASLTSVISGRSVTGEAIAMAQVSRLPRDGSKPQNPAFAAIMQPVGKGLDPLFTNMDAALEMVLFGFEESSRKRKAG